MQATGAIKWTNAEVLLVNVPFARNTAEYGPDIASYAVKLSPLTGLEKSGAPLTLIFELLDHSGSRVTVSPSRFLEIGLHFDSAVSWQSGDCVKIGSLLYPTLTIYAPPASTQVVAATLAYDQKDFGLYLQGSITVFFQHCVPCEILRADRCETCVPGPKIYLPIYLVIHKNTAKHN